MKCIFTTIFVSWIVAEVFCGEEHSCKVWKKEDCIRTIDCGFTIKTKTFTLRHKTSSGNEEIVAVCDWIVGSFSCDVAGGYSVNITSPTTLRVSIDSDVTCPNGSYILTSNGQGKVACSLDPFRGDLEPSEPEEQITTGCQKNTANNTLIVQVVVPIVAALFITAVITAVVLLRRRKRRRKKLIQGTLEVELSPIKPI